MSGSAMPGVRSNADCRADEIVAAYERAADRKAYFAVLDRALQSMEQLAQLQDRGPYLRADAARSKAYAQLFPKLEGRL